MLMFHSFFQYKIRVVVSISYNTILRSHVGPVLAAAARGPSCDEFATLGTDGSIRLWDVISGEQRFEFTSQDDKPWSAAFHPLGLHMLACGFDSGRLRVFDVESTSTVVERRVHSLAVTQLLFARPDDTRLLLFSAALDGHVVAYDALKEYSPLKSLSVGTGPVPSIHLAVNDEGRLIAAATTAISTIVVYDTVELVALFRGGAVAPAAHHTSSPNFHPPSKSSPGHSLSSPSSPLPASDSIAAHSQLQGQEHGTVTPSTDVGRMTLTRSSSSGTEGAAAGPSPGSVGSSQSAPVVGLAFFDSRPGERDTGAGGGLLVATDKHLVSLPMSFAGMQSASERQRSRRLSVWDQRSVRRLVSS